MRYLHAAVAGFAVGILTGATIAVSQTAHDWILVTYWTCSASIISGCFVAFVVGKRYTHLEPAAGRVLCIVPAFNEPAGSLERTVSALLRQTVPVEIVVIDDGSTPPVVPTSDDPRVKWMRQENTGKRGAQVAVLRLFGRDEFDFVLTVDSDSQPYPDACEHLLRAMSDQRVQAATGMIYIRNYSESWVSLAADIDIGSSCVMMRASRSMLGALETTSGALALYRSALLYDHLEAYAVECGTGDDRWLALRALRRGEVVAVAEARVVTEMPATVKGTYRQRLRWSRSWWWMLPYVFCNLSPRQVASPMYGLLQLLITPFLFVYALVILASAWLSAGNDVASPAIWLYAAAYVTIRYALSALYLIGRPEQRFRSKLISFFIGTPCAIMLNVLILSPTRYWALTKLFDNRWQTREIDLQPSSVTAQMMPARTTARRSSGRGGAAASRMQRLGLALLVSLTALATFSAPVNATMSPHPIGAALGGRAQPVTHRTVVTLSFDDGFADQMRALYPLRYYHFHATFYVNSELLNSDGRLSFAQVRRIAADGNEIGGHTSDHRDLVSVDLPEQRRQVCDDRIALAAIAGQAPRSFAYPYGASDARSEEVVRACGYSSARGVGGISSYCTRNCTFAESTPPRDPYLVRTSYSFVPATSIRAAEAAVARARAHGGGWVPLVFHQICHRCSNLAIAPRDFSALLAWLAKQRASGVVVKTVGSVIGGSARPLVKAPPHRGPYAVLENPGLARAGRSVTARKGAKVDSPDALGDGGDAQEVSRCWRRAGFGQNRALWRRGSFGRDGSVAEEVSMTRYTSGDAKLIVRPDSGSCSPQVVPGVVYRLSAWYRATAPVRFVVYIRSSAGRWAYWFKSPEAAPSSNWKALSFSMPSVPPRVTNISFGLSLGARGSMIVDDFGMAGAGRPSRLSPLLHSRSSVGEALAAVIVAPFCIAVAVDAVRRRRRRV